MLGVAGEGCGEALPDAACAGHSQGTEELLEPAVTAGEGIGCTAGAQKYRGDSFSAHTKQP